ncbi:MAG: tetratricopeptide repeat protein [Leptolyngbya sp.]|nr:tetratricopeptide repeat protein [Candidatus Melainabacteria bacterium]
MNQLNQLSPSLLLAVLLSLSMPGTTDAAPEAQTSPTKQAVPVLQRKAPPQAVKDLEQAVKLSQAKKWALAHAAYTKVLKTSPELGVVYADRALCSIALGKFQAAIDDCNRAIKFQKDSAEVYSRRAACYTALKKYDLAIADYSKVISILPSSADAYRNRARVYEKKGNKSKAVQDFSMAAKALSGKLPVGKDTGKTTVLAVQGNKIVDLSTVSTDKFDQAVAKDTEHKSANLMQRATVNMLRGDAAKALEDVNVVLKGSDADLKKDGLPPRPKILLLRITAYQKLARHEDAIADCNEVLKTAPGEEQALISRAISELALGKNKEAIVDADKIKTNPRLMNAAKIVKQRAEAAMK